MVSVDRFFFQWVRPLDFQLISLCERPLKFPHHLIQVYDIYTVYIYIYIYLCLAAFLLSHSNVRDYNSASTLFEDSSHNGNMNF
jgi:hypothetical protein